MPRSHDRQNFFKYTSPDAAIAILENSSFKWSSPKIFNDPFDHQAGFELAMNKDDFMREFVSSSLKVIMDSESSLACIGTLKSVYASCRDGIANDGLSLEKLTQFVTHLAEEVYGNLQKDVHDRWNQKIIEMLCETHVFCVAESKCEIVMWSHYADEHKGVVFELNCIDEIDNNLLAATKVKYKKNCVPFPDAEKYAKHLTGENIINMVDLVWELATTKFEAWGYENEWRVRISTILDSEKKDFVYIPEDVKVFGAMYLGCRMDPEVRAKLLDLARKKFPDMKIYDVKKNYFSFNLNFEEVK